jgi:hypothetical protein
MRLRYLGSNAFTSKVCASSTVLQLNTETQKLWRYAALQWHNVKTKNGEYQLNTWGCVVVGVNDRTVLHGIRVLKIALPW